MTRPHRSGAELLEGRGEGGNGWAGHAEPGQDWGFALEGGESPGGLWAEPLLTQALSCQSLPPWPRPLGAGSAHVWPTPPHGHQGLSKAGGQGGGALRSRGGIMGKGQLLLFWGDWNPSPCPPSCPLLRPQGSPDRASAALCCVLHRRRPCSLCRPGRTGLVAPALGGGALAPPCGRDGDGDPKPRLAGGGSVLRQPPTPPPDPEGPVPPRGRKGDAIRGFF